MEDEDVNRPAEVPEVEAEVVGENPTPEATVDGEFTESAPEVPETTDEVVEETTEDAQPE